MLSRPLGVLVLTVGLLLAPPGCDNGPTYLTGDPDGAARDRAEAADEAGFPEVEGSVDDAVIWDPGLDPGEVVDVGDADDAGPTCRAECDNDPPDSAIGTPCLDDSDCESGISCWSEEVQVWDGADYTTWRGGYCATMGVGAAGCDPLDPESCPDGSTCLDFGSYLGLHYYGCMDLCSAASYAAVPWNDNCDCRDGYSCDLASELCLSGCSNDRECCEIWIDANENGRRNRDEVTLLDASRCQNSCDPCTFACTQLGCPGGGCAIGDPCQHDADCPALATCWTEEWGPVGGMCVLQRCDLVGRECPTGSGCANLGSIYEPYFTCLVPCESGTQPGDPGFPCRDTGPAGPSTGDHACMPTDASAWFDGTGSSGYCWAGNFPGGDLPVGSRCREDVECNSPHGLGLCATWFGPGFCTVMCDEATARDGICEFDPAATTATGACFSSVCLETCEVAGGPLGASGCDNPVMACYDATGIGGYLWFADGREPAAGYCYPACSSDDFCAETWGGGSVCDETSGICSR
jgi:hypothetical protein